MTNTPDLTNASPGDVYQGPDGRLWNVDHVGGYFVALYGNSSNQVRPYLVFTDSPTVKDFKKVDG